MDEPWRFRSTLDQHLPAGAVAEPLMELSLPRQQRVIVLAAVLRAGAPEVGVERWTFEQIPGEEGLTLVEGGERLVRLSPGPRHQQLGDLRRSLAQPRAVLTRPVGLGDEPEATLEALRAALLAHACVDLGVFQFVYGLLRGRYRVRLQPVPAALRTGTFYDVARHLELDDHDRPVTPIGLQLPAPEAPGSDGKPSLLINPGPRHPVSDAVGLLVLVES
ncbi:MAG: hypothetical protein KDK70_11225 [Myxococcales bacterium]|nr:hypothetical protein [Myxococcales bacterium]